MEPFIGEIRLLPFSYAPKNWALCNGQLIAIRANTALFSVIGTTYGGDGTTTFALPNLQGRVVAGVGTGNGLTPWAWGDERGEDSVSLLPAEMPMHNHTITGMNNPGSVGTPAADTYLAKDARSGTGITNYTLTPPVTPDVTMAPQMLGVTGGNQPHENRQPFLSLNYCIALAGTFPARN